MWLLRVLNHRAAIAPLALASVLLTAQAPLPEPVTDTETELGLAVYNELKGKGQIIASSPLYDTLGPVVEPIAKVAQAHYEHPFKFFLVHEAQPNAFSVPGGNVYVTDSLLYFVKNKEELTGTLCHEVAHTIHHDAMTKVQESRKILAREVGTAILLGPTLAKAIAIGMIGDLHSQAYSRDIETAADVTGSDICAAAGSILGVWSGSFRTSRTRIQSRFRNSCPIIQPTSPGSRHLKTTFVIARLSFPDSIPAVRRPRH